MRVWLSPFRIAISMYGLAMTASTEARVMRIMCASTLMASVSIGRKTM